MERGWFATVGGDDESSEGLGVILLMRCVAIGWSKACRLLLGWQELREYLCKCLDLAPDNAYEDLGKPSAFAVTSLPIGIHEEGEKQNNFKPTSTQGKGK